MTDLRGVCNKVIEHYEECLDQYGDGPRAVDWRDLVGQELRFKVLTEIMPLEGLSVLDVGCGLGHLYQYLRESGLKIQYVGLDLSAKMITNARRRFSEVRFIAADLLSDAAPGLAAESFDVLIANGLFLVKMDTPVKVWEEFVRSMIVKMWETCTRGISFNLLSTKVDFQAQQLYYCAPDEILRFALELSRYVVIRHDYPLYEYSVYIYKQPPLGTVGCAK